MYLSLLFTKFRFGFSSLHFKKCASSQEVCRRKLNQIIPTNPYTSMILLEVVQNMEASHYSRSLFYSNPSITIVRYDCRVDHFLHLPTVIKTRRCRFITQNGINKKASVNRLLKIGSKQALTIYLPPELTPSYGHWRRSTDVQTPGKSSCTTL
jgi:hypothetical protein